MLSRTFEQYVKYMHARYETPSHVSDLHTTMNKKTLLTQCQTSNSAEKTQLKLTKKCRFCQFLICCCCRNHRRPVGRRVVVRPGPGQPGPRRRQEAQAQHAQDCARPHRPQREAAQHPEDLLLGQPPARRPDEGAAGRDDGTQSPRHPGLVPEQALQGGLFTFSLRYSYFHVLSFCLFHKKHLRLFLFL